MVLNKIKLGILRWLGRASIWPDGHFYSPVVGEKDLAELRRQGILSDLPSSGIEFSQDTQNRLAEALIRKYKNEIFSYDDSEGLRYNFNSSAFPVCDALIAQAIIRGAKPKLIIEVGSGASTCLMADINRGYFDQAIELHSIDPYAAENVGLQRLISSGEVVFHETVVQEINFDLFDRLGSGDILFIDSSHVAKAGSDVNWLFFAVLPRLKDGVLVHFHDIFFPFEYPWSWIEEGRSWNEAYLLRAFLQFNHRFKVLLINSALRGHELDLPEPEKSLIKKGSGGSLWMAPAGFDFGEA